VPDRVKPSFVIFDIRALWRSVLNPVWHRMLYHSYTHMATVGVRGLNAATCACIAAWSRCRWCYSSSRWCWIRSQRSWTFSPFSRRAPGSVSRRLSRSEGRSCRTTPASSTPSAPTRWPSAGQAPAAWNDPIGGRSVSRSTVANDHRRPFSSQRRRSNDNSNDRLIIITDEMRGPDGRHERRPSCTKERRIGSRTE